MFNIYIYIYIFKNEEKVYSENRSQPMIVSGLFGDVFQKLNDVEQENDKKRLHLLGDDLKYHPNYKDVKEVIEEIKKRVVEQVKNMIGKKTRIHVIF